MEESTEIWIVTSLSVLAALVVALLVRRVFTHVLKRVTFDENQREMVVFTSNVFQAFISTFMLVVPTYEKCLLVSENLIFQYYLSTFILTIIYRYVLTSVSPNPLAIFAEQWKEVSTAPESSRVVNSEAEASSSSSANGVVRRRGGETIQPNSTIETGRQHNFEESRSRVFISFKKSAPSFIGLYLGLYAAIEWLHFAWDGYLTSHHTSKTGMLKDCIRCLQTGPAQGFVVEAFVTFFLHYVGRKLNQQRFGDPAQTYLVVGILFSLIGTITLYLFINVTGAFANPLLAYALERECLYDVTSIINHVVVYWLGAFVGYVAFYTVPISKHFQIVTTVSLLFLVVYIFVPSAIVAPFVLF